ncbi:MAG: hypothetical protein CVT68_10055, partial [Actinobacteria bacterium HGW-Actinobacteria-8]
MAFGQLRELVSGSRYGAYAKRTDGVLFALGFVFLVAWTLDTIEPDLPSPIPGLITSLLGIIWFAFVVDLVVRITLAHSSWRFIANHPLMLRGVTSVAADTVKGAAVHALVEGGCAQMAAHTNADAASDGVADALAAAFGVSVHGALVPAPGRPSPVGSGRVGTIEPVPLKTFAAAVAAALPATAAGVLYAGDPDGIVATVA